jgi:hypothetical protein
MPLLASNKVADISTKQTSVRVKTAGTKLSREEFARLEDHCRRLDIKPGELIRQLILDELSTTSKARDVDPVLAEIVGVRLLLVNLLRPRDERDALTPTTFDLLVDEIKRVKKQVAGELIQKEEVW